MADDTEATSKQEPEESLPLMNTDDTDFVIGSRDNLKGVLNASIIALHKEHDSKV